MDMAKVEELKKLTYRPMELFEEHKDFTTDPEVNPNYILPKMFMFRIQKAMDEYVGGVSANFTTNEAKLNRAMELLQWLKEDSEKLAARNLHELMRCWENIHRMWQAESHTRTIMARKETRWPGYYFRADYPTLDEENWKKFVNIKWDPNTQEWEIIERPVIDLLK